MPDVDPQADSPLADDSRVQRFLELAAPLFLERRDLEERVWPTLQALARQTGLSDAELEAVVAALRREGVIGRTRRTTPRRAAEQSGEAGLSAAGSTAELAAGRPPVDGRWADAEARKRVAAFLERARVMVAEHGALDHHAYAVLVDMAHSQGLSERQFDESLGQLGGPTAPFAISPLRLDGGRSSPVARPAEQFRAYLRRAVRDKKERRGHVSASAERKLVEEGVRKLGLSPVYARMLVHEVAEELRAPVVSHASRRTVGGEPGPSDDAVGGVPAPAHVNWQDEQLLAWREDLRQLLAPLAGGLLAPQSCDHLLWRAEHLHGVPPLAARAALHEAAETQGLSIVTTEQARQYVAALIRDRMGSAERLSADDEWELAAEGEQWGLERDALLELVRDCAARNRRRRARECWLLAAALAFACLAVATLLGAFYAAVLGELHVVGRAA